MNGNIENWRKAAELIIGSLLLDFSRYKAAGILGLRIETLKNIIADKDMRCSFATYIKLFENAKKLNDDIINKTLSELRV